MNIIESLPTTTRICSSLLNIVISKYLIIAWSIPVGESTTFTPKINLIRYDFDDTEMGTIAGGGNPQDMSFTQEFDVISFTLAHYF